MKTLKSMASHEEHILRQERLVFNVSVVANATPADKKESVDIPGAVIMRMEGQTAAADAAEAGISWTAPKDNDTGDSVFGILLDLDENIADKVYSVTVTEKTALAASLSVSGPGAQPEFLTAEGNIGIEVDATGLNLASESPTFLVTVEYREKR